MVTHVQDVEEARGKISDSLLQRLILKPQKIAQLAEGIRAIAAQEEPIRRVLARTQVADSEWQPLAGAVLQQLAVRRRRMDGWCGCAAAMHDVWICMPGCIRQTAAGFRAR
jgi:hypothetical protein